MYGVMLSSPSTWGWLRRSAGGVLVVALCMGTVSLPGVWAATFYVDDDTGDDNRSLAEAQNPSTPWMTITRATGEPTLASGDTIQVAAGTYDTVLGETFPLELVDGVALIGDPDDPNSTVISGPGNLHVFHNDDTPLTSATELAGFRLTHDSVVSYEQLVMFEMRSTAMAPVIRDNVFAGDPNDSYNGLDVEDRFDDPRSFTGLIEDNVFLSLGAGIDLEGEKNGTADLSPTIHGNTFSGCNIPIYLSATASFSGTLSPVISNNTFADSQSRDVHVWVSMSTGQGATVSPLIANNTSTGSGGRGILISVSSVTLSSSSQALTVSPTILNNSITGAADDGVSVLFTEFHTGKLVSEITIAGNTATNPGADGIYMELENFSLAQSMSVDWTISNNTITDATTDLGDTGIRFEAEDYLNLLSGDHLHLTVSGNTVTGADQGIAVSMSEFSTSEMSLSVTVSGNTVTGSVRDGFSIGISYLTSFTTSRVDLLDNVADGSGQRGLELGFDDFPSVTSRVQVACNTFVNSGGHGVFVDWDRDTPPPDFGGGDLMSPGLNTFSGNGTVDGYDFYNSDPNDVDAHSNWWGTTDPATINANIWDENDDLTKGTVQHSGWLSAAPTVSATATLTDVLQVDLSPTGPSYGDTIRYTATLEGTGDCGCSSALFVAPIPFDAVYVLDSLTASRGIVINEEIDAGHPDLKVGLGALAAGEVVTVTWDVMAGQGCCLSTQATLSCYQLGDVLTDDPNAPGDDDPTTVELEHLFCDGFESGDVSSW